METIDTIRINFEEGQLFILNICLAFLMFGVALDIKISDFTAIFKRPKAPIIGLISQLILLPILTIGLIYLLQPPPSLALGMILISVCPGGNVSNFAVHLAGANAALSVMLTSIVTLSAIFVTPLYFGFWTNFIPGTEQFNSIIEVSPAKMMNTILTLVFLPLIIGMFLNHRYPSVTKRIEKPVRLLSILVFLCFVVFAIAGNYDNIVQYVHLVFFLVLIHNTLAFTMGYWFARLNRLPVYDAQAISIETGIQNSGLGLILIFNFFDGIGGMAMIAAWWGIWHLLSGFALATYWSKKRKNDLKTDIS